MKLATTITALVVFGSMAATTQADTLYWRGGTGQTWDATNTHWNTVNSGSGIQGWTPNDGTVTAAFQSNYGTTTVSGTLNVNGFSNTWAGTFDGGAINLGSGGWNSNANWSGPSFSNTTIGLTASQTWNTQGNNHTLQLNNTAVLNMGSNDLLLTTSGGNTFTGFNFFGDVTGDGTITVELTNGRVWFSDPVSWTGDFIVNFGLVQSRSGAAAPQFGALVQVGDGTNTATMENNNNNADWFKDTAELVINNMGTLDMANKSDKLSEIRLNNGGLLTSTSAVTMTTDFLWINGVGQQAGTYTSSNFSGIGSQVSVVVLNTVPEPASLALLGLGALAMVRRRR